MGLPGLTRVQADKRYVGRPGVLELMPMAIFGDSYAQGGAGADNGTRFWDRIAARFRTLTPTNVGVSGQRADQILMTQIVPTWVPNSRGLVGLGDVVINDARQFGVDTPPATTLEAFRSCLVYLTSKAILPVTNASFAFGPGWTAGSTSTAAAYVDVQWTGTTCHLLVSAVTGTGGTFTITNTGQASADQTVTTGGYLQPFNRSVKLAGGSGSNSARIAVTSGTVALLGLAVPSTTPPTIAWFKPGPYLDQASIQQPRLAAYLAGCAPIAATFPTVLAVDVDGGWDTATMITPDGIHPNDKGHSYIADVIERKLATLSWRQGQNQLTAANDGAVTGAVPAFAKPGATVPLAPTGVTAATAQQLAVTWTRNTDGGATITSQVVQTSPDGSTWTDALTGVAPSATSATIASGLTQGTTYQARVLAVNAIGRGTPSTASSAAAAGAAPTTYASDDFTRADGTIGSTPVGGYAWATTNSAVAAISGNQATMTLNNGNPSDLYISDGQADGVLSLTLPDATLGKSHGMLFRASTTTDGYIFWRNGSASYTVSQRTAANTYTALGNVTVTPAAGDVLTVTMAGTSVSCYLNGTLVASFTDSVNTTKTRHGMWKANAAAVATAIYDNFSHKSG